jgi:TRAP-type C4-dicarboxylate transport system permease small subunit
MIRKTIDLILARFAVIVMAILVVDVLWQVTSRYIMREPSSWTDELAGFLLIWVGLLGAAYATGKKDHLAIDLLPRRLPPGKRKRLDIIINTMIALFALIVMVIGGIRLVYITFRLNQISSALEIPVGIVYIVIPLSGLFILYYAMDDIFNGSTENEYNEY